MSTRWTLTIKCDHHGCPNVLGASLVLEAPRGYGKRLKMLRGAASLGGWSTWKAGRSHRDYCSDHAPAASP